MDALQIRMAEAELRGRAAILRKKLKAREHLMEVDRKHFEVIKARQEKKRQAAKQMEQDQRLAAARRYMRREFQKMRTHAHIKRAERLSQQNARRKLLIDTMDIENERLVYNMCPCPKPMPEKLRQRLQSYDKPKLTAGLLDARLKLAAARRRLLRDRKRRKIHRHLRHVEELRGKAAFKRQLVNLDRYMASIQSAFRRKAREWKALQKSPRMKRVETGAGIGTIQQK